MAGDIRLFKIGQPERSLANWGDVVVLVGIAALLYLGVRLAVGAPAVVCNPRFRCRPVCSQFMRPCLLDACWLHTSIDALHAHLWASSSADSRRAEHVLMPILDVLQSVPILLLSPVVLLSFTAILPLSKSAIELASIASIFTTQAWNMTFAVTSRSDTIPTELREAPLIFRFTGWHPLQDPGAALCRQSVPIWNSMMSWAGGWFFLMASEIFTVGADAIFDCLGWALICRPRPTHSDVTRDPLRRRIPWCFMTVLPGSICLAAAACLV